MGLSVLLTLIKLKYCGLVRCQPSSDVLLPAMLKILFMTRGTYKALTYQCHTKPAWCVEGAQRGRKDFSLVAFFSIHMVDCHCRQENTMKFCLSYPGWYKKICLFHKSCDVFSYFWVQKHFCFPPLNYKGSIHPASFLLLWF